MRLTARSASANPIRAWLYPGRVHFALEDDDNRPSRWNTLRAQCVLSWYEQSAFTESRSRFAPSSASLPKKNGPVVTDLEKLVR